MSQIAGAAVAHLGMFPVESLDGSTLRCLSEIIGESIAKHEEIAATIPADCREHWDSFFTEELEAARQAHARIVAEIERRQQPKETTSDGEI